MTYDSVLNDKLLRAHQLEKVLVAPVVLALSDRQRKVCHNSVVGEIEQLKADVAKMTNVDTTNG